ESRADGAGLGAVVRQPLAPVAQRVVRHLQAHLHSEAMSGARWRRHRPREEGQIRSRMPLGVGVEQMVGAGIVLIDAALDQPHPQPARVEVEILLRRPRNRGDVMDAVDTTHGPPPTSILLSMSMPNPTCCLLLLTLVAAAPAAAAQRYTARQD